MRSRTAVIIAMVATEVVTNLHALMPSNMVETVTANGITAEVYDNAVLDPWMIRMVSLSIASAAMCLLFTFVKMDGSHRSYTVGWSVYFLAQAAQRATGRNVLAYLFGDENGPNDLWYDAGIMLVCIAGAWAFDRFRRPSIMKRA